MKTNFGGTMKTALLATVLAIYGGYLCGCSDDNTAEHQKTQEQTVTDPNGNVISHTETKTQSDSTSNNPNNNP
jgi:hypothetical protein